MKDFFILMQGRAFLDKYCVFLYERKLSTGEKRYNMVFNVENEEQLREVARVYFPVKKEELKDFQPLETNAEFKTCLAIATVGGVVYVGISNE